MPDPFYTDYPWMVGTMDTADTQPIDTCGEDWDDFDHLDMCSYCESKGKVIPFAGPTIDCPTCEGAGWVAKGQGLNREQAKAIGKA